jgi:hypothetical protein
MTPHTTEPGHPGAGLYAEPATAALLHEALALLGDGVPAATIEAAAAAAGMPQGVLALLDAVSLETLDHALHAELDALGHGHSHHAHDHSHDHHGHSHEGHGHDHGHAHAHDASPAHVDVSGKAPAAGHDHGHDKAASTADHKHADGHGHAHHHDHDQPHDHAHAAPPADAHGHARAPDAVVVAAPTVARKPAQKVKSRAMTESAVYVVEKMAHGFKRAGRKGGAGFYDYGSESPQLWSGLKTFERSKGRIPAEDVRDRLVHAAALGALSLPRAEPLAALASAFGPDAHWNVAGLLGAAAGPDAGSRFAARSRELALRYGPRFEPTAEQLARVAPGGR